MASALEQMPLLPMPLVVFPYSQLQIRVDLASQRDLVAFCSEHERCFGVVLIREAADGVTEPYLVGTAVHIDKVMPSPDGSLDVLVRGQRRIRVRKLDQDAHSFLLGHVEPVVELEIENPERADALTYRLKECFEEFIASELLTSEIAFRGIKLPDDPTALSFMAANLLQIDDLEKQRILETTDTVERLATIVPMIQNQIQEKKTVRPARASATMLTEWITRN